MLLAFSQATLASPRSQPCHLPAVRRTRRSWSGCPVHFLGRGGHQIDQETKGSHSFALTHTCISPASNCSDVNVGHNNIQHVRCFFYIDPTIWPTACTACTRQSQTHRPSVAAAAERTYPLHQPPRSPSIGRTRSSSIGRGQSEAWLIKLVRQQGDETTYPVLPPTI